MSQEKQKPRTEIREKTKTQKRKYPKYKFVKAAPRDIPPPTTRPVDKLRDSIKPSQIYDQRVKTQQVLFQNKILRTKLTRLHDIILQKSHAINNTITKTEAKPTTGNYDSKVKQFEDSRLFADNSLKVLEQDIEDAKHDDRYAEAEELEEELKLIYQEYERVRNELKGSEEQRKKVNQELITATQKASKSNLKNLAIQVRILSDENHQISATLDAYSEKHAKNLLIEECRKNKHSLEVEKNEGEKDRKEPPSKEKKETQKKEDQENLKENAKRKQELGQKLDEKLKEEKKQLEDISKKVQNDITIEKEKYNTKVRELENIIKNMKDQIASFLLKQNDQEKEESSNADGSGSNQRSEEEDSNPEEDQ